MSKRVMGLVWGVNIGGFWGGVIEAELYWIKREPVREVWTAVSSRQTAKAGGGGGERLGSLSEQMRWAVTQGPGGGEHGRGGREPWVASEGGGSGGRVWFECSLQGLK